ncbi:hypothetical protein ADIMK_1179 [Marinobacterium lacunae]|uniref:Oxidoreductase molybdopterin-binding domain-containing protein n=1 Tax=Marinobacterium lacunae TaxID=1232683 RepID=A0A081G1S1_9GAMM|nr:hypothetical protein [Marinobacterium lacunae]KEA64726.1 hypothetical protein ADIMK_1179 [Marinobacterium lacunae]
MKLFAALILSFSCLSAHAAELTQPTGPVILEVTGAIDNTNAEGVARFDKAMLEQLEQHVTKTATPWHEGKVEFEGPLGRALLTAVGAKGDTLVVTAINDYAAEVPAEDFDNYDVILAMKADGKYMRVRDKGPLFIIYPFDENPDLNSEVIHNRSVWQIKKIEIR